MSLVEHVPMQPGLELEALAIPAGQTSVEVVRSAESFYEANHYLLEVVRARAELGANLAQINTSPQALVLHRLGLLHACLRIGAPVTDDAMYDIAMLLVNELPDSFDRSIRIPDLLVSSQRQPKSPFYLGIGSAELAAEAHGVRQLVTSHLRQVTGNYSISFEDLWLTDRPNSLYPRVCRPKSANARARFLAELVLDEKLMTAPAEVAPGLVISVDI